MSPMRTNSWLTDREVLILGFALIFLAGCDSSWSADQSTGIDSPRSEKTDTHVDAQADTASDPIRSDTAIRRLAKLGQATYRQRCSRCHRPDLEGRPPVFPSLNELASRRSRTLVENRIRNGKAAMPSFSYLEDKKINALIIYLMGPESDTEPTPETNSDTESDSRGTKGTQTDTSVKTGDTAPTDSPAISPNRGWGDHPGHRKRHRRRHRQRGSSD